jgi:integrase
MAALRNHTGVSPRALEFVILTAVRTNEALGARWDEIDLRQRMWIVPANRMKGAKEHRVPLSSRAVAVIKEMAGIQQNEFVFAGAKQGRPLSDMALLMLVRDIRPGVTVHALRSTFKDSAADCTTVPNFVSEAALAHVTADRVEAAYRRTDLSEKRRRLMEAWAGYCDHKNSPARVITLAQTR